jgi:hypothetical protein
MEGNKNDYLLLLFINGCDYLINSIFLLFHIIIIIITVTIIISDLGNGYHGNKQCSSKNLESWCGLRNNDNEHFCYINATIQAFATVLLPLHAFESSLTRDNVDLVFGNDNHRRDFALSFLELVKCLDLSKVGNEEKRGQQKIAAAGNNDTFLEQFHGLDKSSRNDKFEQGVTHDACLFLLYLWELMDQTFPMEYFSEIFINQCQKCKDITGSVKKNKVLMLTLQDTSDNDACVDITALLQDNFKAVELDCACANCNHTKKEQTKTLAFDTNDNKQRYLVIHLQRCFGGEMNKIFTRVTFDENISIWDAESSSNIEFSVEGIIVHIGRTSKGGHYKFVGKKGVFDDDKLSFDEGDAYNKIISTGVLPVVSLVDCSSGYYEFDKDNDAYGYMYFLVEVPKSKTVEYQRKINFQQSVMKSKQIDDDNKFQLNFGKFQGDHVSNLFGFMDGLEKSNVTAQTLTEWRDDDDEKDIIRFLKKDATLKISLFVKQELHQQWYVNTNDTGECLFLALYQVYLKYLCERSGKQFTPRKFDLTNKKNREEIVRFIDKLRDEFLDSHAFGYDRMKKYLQNLETHFRNYTCQQFPREKWEKHCILFCLNSDFPSFSVYNIIEDSTCMQFLFHRENSCRTDLTQSFVCGEDIVNKCINTKLNMIFYKNHYFLPNGDLYVRSAEIALRKTINDYAIELYKIFQKTKISRGK